MSLEAEIEILKRLNCRLKVALFSTLTVLIVSVLAGIGFFSFMAVRARAEQLRAVEMERRARAQLKAMSYSLGDRRNGGPQESWARFQG